MNNQKKQKMSRLSRYTRRINKALEGTHSPKLNLNFSITGCASDTWTTLREVASPIHLEDKEIFVLLLLRGARKLRAEMRALQAELRKAEGEVQV